MKIGMKADVVLSYGGNDNETTAFFKQAVETVGYKPGRVTTDGNDAYPRAIRRVLGRRCYTAPIAT